MASQSEFADKVRDALAELLGEWPREEFEAAVAAVVAARGRSDKIRAVRRLQVHAAVLAALADGDTTARGLQGRLGYGLSEIQWSLPELMRVRRVEPIGNRHYRLIDATGGR